ncbi:MAG: hypothetical protein LBB13_03510, partial [Rickettsiales bacterium]|nr:hypothetical protein [Rickettsiales bacterium]
MKILEEKKIDCLGTNIVLCSGLALVAIFSAVTMAVAEITEVNSFVELQEAIVNEKTKIAVKNAINFTADGPLIDYSDIVISGPSENAPGLLDGKDKYKFFMFGENTKNISLKNLHLKNGSIGDRDDYIAGGSAIQLGARLVISLEGLTFSNNQTRSRGGAIYSWGTDGSNRNSLNFTGKTIF